MYAKCRPSLPFKTRLWSSPVMNRRTLRIKVDDRMQQGYVYELTEPPGKGFHPGFRPELTPKQMLALGVFGGKYMTDCAANSLRTGSRKPNFVASATTQNLITLA